MTQFGTKRAVRASGRTIGMGAVAVAAGAMLTPLGAGASVIQTFPGDGANINFGGVTEFTYAPKSGNATYGTLTGGSVAESSSGVALKLSAGATVGPSPFAHSGTNNPIDVSATPTFVALEVAVPGSSPSYNFGYAEFDTSQTLLGYAFESTPDTAITVVDVVPGGAQPPGGTDVPEPASLALLAAGVASVGMIRRRARPGAAGQTARR